MYNQYTHAILIALASTISAETIASVLETEYNTNRDAKIKAIASGLSDRLPIQERQRQATAIYEEQYKVAQATFLK